MQHSGVRPKCPLLNADDSHEPQSLRPIGPYSARLLVRRWPLYALTCAFVYLLEVLFVQYAHVAHAARYIELIGSPLISVVVMVNVGADALGAAAGTATRWEVIVERAWAVVAVDAGMNLVFMALLRWNAGALGDPLLTTFASLTLAALLVYAEPLICLGAERRTLNIVPAALIGSCRLAWRNLPRVFYLTAFALALDVLESFLLQAGVKIGPQGLKLWVDLPFQALATLPLSALFTIAYLDTAAHGPSA